MRAGFKPASSEQPATPSPRDIPAFQGASPCLAEASPEPFEGGSPEPAECAGTLCSRFEGHDQTTGVATASLTVKRVSAPSA